MSQTFRDLLVWRKAMDLVIAVYELTGQFPNEERYGLTSQIRRSAVSIPSNIAEGRYRGGAKEFRQFLRVAFGSGGELETQLEIAKRLPQTQHLDYSKADEMLTEVMKMLNVFIQKLMAKS